MKAWLKPAAPPKATCALPPRPKHGQLHVPKAPEGDPNYGDYWKMWSIMHYYVPGPERQKEFHIAYSTSLHNPNNFYFWYIDLRAKAIDTATAVNGIHFPEVPIPATSTSSTPPKPLEEDSVPIPTPESLAAQAGNSWLTELALPPFAQLAEGRLRQLYELAAKIDRNEELYLVATKDEGTKKTPFRDGKHAVQKLKQHVLDAHQAHAQQVVSGDGLVQLSQREALLIAFVAALSLWYDAAVKYLPKLRTQCYKVLYNDLTRGDLQQVSPSLWGSRHRAVVSSVARSQPIFSTAFVSCHIFS
jgi:hypothetical protein